MASDTAAQRAFRGHTTPAISSQTFYWLDPNALASHQQKSPAHRDRRRKCNNSPLATFRKLISAGGLKTNMIQSLRSRRWQLFTHAQSEDRILATTPQPLLSSQPATPAKTVASTGHTIFLLIVLAAWSTWGYFGAKHARTGQDPHRIATYVLTSVWEWLVVGYIAWGARRHGTSLSELTGPRWK